MECYILLETFWKGLFKGNDFETSTETITIKNLKPRIFRWKFFLTLMTNYTSLSRLEKGYLMVLFSKTLVENWRNVLGWLTSDGGNHLHIFRVIDCLNTIYDMQNGMKYLNHYSEFLHILDFETLFWKIVGAFLVFGILNNNVYLYLMD